MGHFNVPHLSWKYSTVTVGTSKRVVYYTFFSQLVSEPARKGALPDLPFVNEEGLMAEAR